MKLYTGFQYIIFSLIFLLNSCSRSTENDEAKLREKEQFTTEVNWIGHWKNEGKREDLVREIANEFEFRNQNIKVNLAFPDEVYFKSSANGAASDQEEVDFIALQITKPQSDWDIIRLKDHYPRVAAVLKDPDWGRKYLVDFSEFEDFRNMHQDFVFDKEFKDANGGITIGPYNEGFYYALWYNKPLADKMGISIKQFGMTPEDFISYLKAADEYNKANGTDIIPMFEEQSWIISPMLLNTMFYSLAGDYLNIVNTNYDPKKIEYLEKVLRIFERMSQYNPLPKNRIDVAWAKTFNWTLDQKCLFYPQGSWMYTIWNGIDNKKTRNMVPVEMPTFSSNNQAYIGGYKACWAVPKNAPHKKEAIELLKFWASPKNAEKWVRYTKCPTGVKGSITTTTLGFDQFEDFQFYITKKYGLHMLNPVDNAYILGARNASIQIPVMDIIEKRQTVDQVMRNIKRQLR